MLRLLGNKRKRPQTPPSDRPGREALPLESRSKKQKPHYDSPTKQKVAGALEVLEATGMPFSKTEVYQFYDMKPRAGRELDLALREAREEELNRAARAAGVHRDAKKCDASTGKRTQDFEVDEYLSDDAPAEPDPDVGHDVFEEEREVEAMARGMQEADQRQQERDKAQEDDEKLLPRPTEDVLHRRHNQVRKIDKRGGRRKLSNDEIQEMDHLLTEWPESRLFSWAALGEAIGRGDVHERTIKRAMHVLNWHMCIPCKRAYCTASTAKDRKQYSEVMLSRYPHPHQWKKVRFSDEIHFGYGPNKTLHIIRKPGTRKCPSCVVQVPPTEKAKEAPRLHAWAAVGYNFKSRLVWYTTKSANGKMSMEVYVDQILEAEVKKWLERGDDFVLEEDGDSGHGGKPKEGRDENVVLKWKREHELKCYFNCHDSPDFSPVENAWQAPKTAVKQVGHFNEEVTREAAEEAWDKLPQKVINEWVLSMPERFSDCIELDGQRTGH